MPRRNKTITHKKHQTANIAMNCNSKRRFLNKNEAEKMAEYQMLINPDLQLSVYQCDLCHRWHLTKNQHKSYS